MKPSKNIIKMFNQKRMTRKDIENYGQTKDEKLKNSIEQKSLSCDFESESLEGWQQLNYDLDVMKNIDKKFKIKPSIYPYIIIGILSMIGIIAMIFVKASEKSNQENNIISKNKREQYIELSDVKLPQQITKMSDAPKNKQISPEKIAAEFEQRTIEERKEEYEPIIIDFKPIHNIKDEDKTNYISTRTINKERYIENLKTIDYHGLRKETSIVTEQIFLNGLEASQEKHINYDSFEKKTISISYEKYLKKTIKMVQEQEYQKALTRLQIIIKNYPDDLNALFYSGLCLFNLGKYNESILSLEKCLNNRFANFDQESMWIIAQSYSLKNDLEKAKEIYIQIIQLGGYYSEQAKIKIKTL